MKIYKLCNKKPCFLNSAFLPLILFGIFGLVYYIYFSFSKNNIISSIEIENENLIRIFDIYGGFIGFGLGFLIMIIVYIFYIIKKAFGMKHLYFLNPIFNLLAFYFIFFIANHLLFNEPRYTNEAVAIIEFVGKPLYITSQVFFYFCLIWLFFSLTLFTIKSFAKGK